tara:strand:+ start:6917 stop:7624 length:708 start_codon:yes stop_codon:yes gene_type:complete
MTLDITKSYYYNYNAIFKPLIPILVERKYCYSAASSKGNIEQIENAPISKYNLFNLQVKHPILKQGEDDDFNPDNSLKEHIMNPLTEVLINQIASYKSTAIIKNVNKSLTSSNKTLLNHQTDIIKNLNNNLNDLNNEKHNNILSYSRKDYNKNKYKFYTKLMIDTILVFCIIFLLNSLSSGSEPILPKNIIFYINAIIIGIYMCVLVIKLNSVNGRNKNNWNKFNFRNITVEEKV